MYDNKNEGALWFATNRETGEKKVTRNGDNYWTGNITVDGKSYPVTMFFTAQNKKKNPKQPDFKIVFNEQRQEQAAVPQAPVNTDAPPF